LILWIDIDTEYFHQYIVSLYRYYLTSLSNNLNVMAGYYIAKGLQCVWDNLSPKVSLLLLLFTFPPSHETVVAAPTYEKASIDYKTTWGVPASWICSTFIWIANASVLLCCTEPVGWVTTRLILILKAKVWNFVLSIYTSVFALLWSKSWIVPRNKYDLFSARIHSN
jgi:hypothetical protein